MVIAAGDGIYKMDYNKVLEYHIEKKADVLITGDIGHHEGIDAAAQGLCIIDAGHYGIEHIFTEDVKKFLETHVEGTDVAGAPVRHPFIII